MLEITNEMEQLTTADKRKVAVNLLKEFTQSCAQLGIPVFAAMYLPEKGYKYRAVLPEEIAEEMADDVSSEYGRFAQFLKTCVDFNREDYLPHIKKEFIVNQEE